MRNFSLLSFFWALAVLNTASAVAEEKLSLTVNVSGATPDTGQAICALFDSEENYLKQPLALQTQSVNSDGRVVCYFEQLTAGTYAVSVIYDEDKNGELNTGLLGIPSELVGMSNNAKGLFGPPSFEKTSFSLTQSQTIEIVLGKAKD